jgi:integrase
MEEGWERIDERIKEVNTQLERVTLRRKGGKLYIRGRFPLKPGSQVRERHELPTGCNATPAGLKVAIAKAKEIDSLLQWDKFDWAAYQKGKTVQPVDITIQEWVERYELAHWEQTERTPSKESSFQSCYRHYFHQLPQSECLTLELLRNTITARSGPATRSRELYCMSYGRLAEFVSRHGGIDASEYLAFKDELKRLKQGYKTKPILPDDLPTEFQIIEIWQSIKNPAWRWIYGMLATYGLRPHEPFNLDLERFIKETEALRVLKTTKTGARLTYPCPALWREQFQLWNARLPNITTAGKSNEHIGKKVSQEFRELRIPHIPYALRHAWCIRLALRGTDSAIAAKWAGHSLAIHEKTYLQAISEAQHQQVFEQMKRREASQSSFDLGELTK